LAFSTLVNITICVFYKRCHSDVNSCLHSEGCECSEEVLMLLAGVVHPS